MKNYQMLTKNGHNFYDMASLLQKAIRRGEYKLAGYAANELQEKYRNYLWKRLLVISAEDCYGIITKEIIALKLADDESNKKQPIERKDKIFISKAITLLCMAKKNRDACYFACNFMISDDLLPDDAYEHFNIEDGFLPDDTIPDWVYDVHTLKGKVSGKTIADMIKDEQNALQPHQVGLFDDMSWREYIEKYNT